MSHGLLFVLLVAGQFLSTVEVKTNKNIRTPGTIYKVLPGGNITEYHRNVDTGAIQSLNISGTPGQGNFPTAVCLEPLEPPGKQKTIP